MSRLMVLTAALWLSAVVYACGSEGHPDDTCETAANCTSNSCQDPNEFVCCPDGLSTCTEQEKICRPLTECLGIKPPECTEDANCPQPDPRCGVGRCTNGKCELDIQHAGEFIPNQIPGDCKGTLCDLKGELTVWFNPVDQPFDGNDCTLDFCDGDTPDVQTVPNKTPCSEEKPGYCVEGACVECSTMHNVKTCPSGLYCDVTKCVPEHCKNQTTDSNLGETSKDCGGECYPCYVGEGCSIGADCQSDVCIAGKCQAPTHTDGVKNDGETGIDCGWSGGPLHLCKDEQGCDTSDDCQSLVCYLGVCQAPTCLDATQNGAETGVDCGDKCPACILE